MSIRDKLSFFGLCSLLWFVRQMAGTSLHKWSEQNWNKHMFKSWSLAKLKCFHPRCVVVRRRYNLTRWSTMTESKNLTLKIIQCNLVGNVQNPYNFPLHPGCSIGILTMAHYNPYVTGLIPYKRQITKNFGGRPTVWKGSCHFNIPQNGEENLRILGKRMEQAPAQSHHCCWMRS